MTVRIDNTAFGYWKRCGRMFYERYEAEGLGSVLGGRGSSPAAGRGIELASRERDGLLFGKRFHELLENQRRKLLHLHPREFKPLDIPELESECQSTFAEYEGHYLPEPLRFLEAERTHVLPLPARDAEGNPYELAVKIDGVVRHVDDSIGPLDTKTEEAGGIYNARESWAARTQASVYLWALTQLYPNETVSRLVVDVVSRRSPKRPCVFRRMDDISRTPEELREAIQDVIYVCREIEQARKTGFWPSNRNLCKDGWRKCDYYALHVWGRTEENLKLYQIAEQYLDP